MYGNQISSTILTPATDSLTTQEMNKPISTISSETDIKPVTDSTTTEKTEKPITSTVVTEPVVVTTEKIEVTEPVVIVTTEKIEVTEPVVVTTEKPEEPTTSPNTVQTVRSTDTPEEKSNNNCDYKSILSFVLSLFFRSF